MLGFNSEFKASRVWQSPSKEQRAKGIVHIYSYFVKDNNGNEVCHEIHCKDDSLVVGGDSGGDQNTTVKKKRPEEIDESHCNNFFLFRFDLPSEDGATPLVLPEYTAHLDQLRVARLAEEKTAAAEWLDEEIEDV